MTIGRPLRAACFAALALTSLVALGFGFVLRTWDDSSRRIIEFAGYLLFAVLASEAIDSCRHGSVSGHARQRS